VADPQKHASPRVTIPNFVILGQTVWTLLVMSPIKLGEVGYPSLWDVGVAYALNMPLSHMCQHIKFGYST